MKSLHALAAALTALLPGACATAPGSMIVDGGPVREDGFAALGQPTRAGRLVVTPMKVVEDSRCPRNVQCVWAGRVIVTTRIDGAGWQESTDMELGRAHSTHGLRIELSLVQPEKMAGERTPPESYLFGYSGG